MFIDIFIFNGYSNVSMIFCHFIVRIEFYNGIARFLWHSTAFLYRPISGTVQMLKLHTVRWFSKPWRKVTTIAENRGTWPKSR